LPDLTPLHWFAYGIGVIGIAVEWRAYLLHSGRGFRSWSAAGAVLWATQYLLLDAITASVTMALTALRTLISGQWDNHFNRHLAAGGFVLLFAILTAISWQGYPSLLPAFAVINTTLALFYLNNRNMRILLLASSSAWIANDLYWQAWPALIAESVAVIINAHTIRKMFA
jgi:hypothetical protein